MLTSLWCPTCGKLCPIIIYEHDHTGIRCETCRIGYLTIIINNKILLWCGKPLGEEIKVDEKKPKTYYYASMFSYVIWAMDNDATHKIIAKMDKAKKKEYTDLHFKMVKLLQEFKNV